MPSSVLVISATDGYRHESIETGIAYLRTHSSTYTFTFTETPNDIFEHKERLLAYNALLFLSSIGPILSQASLANLAAYTSYPSKAVVGIHSATATCSESASFRTIFGTTFDYHPDLQTATVYRLPEGAAHASTESFPEKVKIEDEWYNFTSDPRETGVKLLLAVDDESYVDEGERLVLEPHPVAWFREEDVEGAEVVGEEEGKGKRKCRCRVWYTSLGHSKEIWGEEVFVRHVMEGLRWATRS